MAGGIESSSTHPDLPRERDRRNGTRKNPKGGRTCCMGITQLGAKRKILMYAAKYGSNAQAPKRQKRLNHGTQEKPEGRGMRCSQCCMYKITGPDLDTHSCRNDLYDEVTGARHTWEECPTQNIKKTS
jgi:hypothetical protein